MDLGIAPLCRWTGSMSITVDSNRLRAEMVRRGWAATDLAHESRLSNATISAALAGRPIAARSLGLIAQALIRTPAIDVVDLLIARRDRLDLA